MNIKKNIIRFKLGFQFAWDGVVDGQTMPPDAAASAHELWAAHTAGVLQMLSVALHH